MNNQGTNHFSTFKINTPQVVHQTIDDETIIIDFGNGAYFSTNGAGAVIWEQIAHNASVNDIGHTLLQRYAGNTEDITKALEQFLIELQGEALIVPLEDTLPEPGLSSETVDRNLTERPAFEPPSLQKFTDMQDLLLLDPIHEVDEQGWPIKKDAT